MLWISRVGPTGLWHFKKRMYRLTGFLLFSAFCSHLAAAFRNAIILVCIIFGDHFVLSLRLCLSAPATHASISLVGLQVSSRRPGCDLR